VVLDRIKRLQGDDSIKELTPLQKKVKEKIEARGHQP